MQRNEGNDTMSSTSTSSLDSSTSEIGEKINQPTSIRDVQNLDGFWSPVYMLVIIFLCLERILNNRLPCTTGWLTSISNR